MGRRLWKGWLAAAKADAPSDFDGPGSDGWEEIRELVTESYRCVAPRKLLELLD